MTRDEFVDVMAMLCDAEDGYYPHMPMSKRMLELWWTTLEPYPAPRFAQAVTAYAKRNPVHPPNLAEIETSVKPRGVVL